MSIQTGELGTLNSQLGEMVLGTFYVQTGPRPTPTSFTAQLATQLSFLGNIELGGNITIQYQNVKNVSASNVLSLVQSVTVHDTGIHESVTDTLTLNQTIIVHAPIIHAAVNQSLSLTQAVRGFNGTKVVGQSLSLTQAVAAVKTYNRASTDNITFIDAASAYRIKGASDTYVISQSVTVLSNKGASDVFTITDSATVVGRHLELPTNILVLMQTVVEYAVRPCQVSDTIVFTQSADGIRTKNLNASNVLVLRDTGTSGKLFRIFHQLDLQQTVVAIRILNRAAQNHLTLSHTGSRTAILNRDLHDLLTFNHTHAKPTNIQGADFVPVGDVVVTKPTPMVIIQNPDRAIVLKRPIFGDMEGGLNKVVQQRTINGRLFTYARKKQTRKLKYTFEMPTYKAEEMRAYIYDYLSVPHQMINWKGEIWYGFITNNPFDLTSKTRRAPYDDEQLQVTVEFEGVRIH